MNKASVTTIKRGSRGSDEIRTLASDIFQPATSGACSDEPLPVDIEQGNDTNGRNDSASPEPPVVHEVNLRTYLMDMLTTLHQQEHIITLPTLLDDETGNSLEVRSNTPIPTSLTFLGVVCL